MSEVLPDAFPAEPGRRIPAVEVIRAKRDGATLSPEQIDAVVSGYARGEVAEEQIRAGHGDCAAGHGRGRDRPVDHRDGGLR